MDENMNERVQRYAEGISARLHITTDNWSFQQYRPALSADTSSVTEAAKGAISVADAEHAELRATLDGLRILRVEDYAQIDEAHERAHVAEDRLARVEAALENHPRACEEHPDGDVVSCGWKGAVLDVQRALSGSSGMVDS